MTSKTPAPEGFSFEKNGRALLIDSHSHIDSECFANSLDEVFGNMHRAGVAGTLIAGCSLKEYPRGLALAQKHPNVWLATGVHPSTDDDDHEAGAEELIELSKPDKVVAIGECGLDYYYGRPPFDAQIERFKTHIKAAEATGLPLVIHSRDAEEDTISLLEGADLSKFNFVLHCFTGSKKMAQLALSLGGYISFSGIVTFKNASQIREVAAMVPSDRYLVETDCPYLAPVPFRGKQNEPSYVRYTAEKVAELRGENINTVARETTENFFRLFPKACLC